MSQPVRNAIKSRIKGIVEGPATPVKGAWFITLEANARIFGVREIMSCEEASVSVDGTTLAAHTDHVRYHMWGINEILKNGKQPQMNWGKSWDIHSVNEQQWNQIKKDIRN